MDPARIIRGDEKQLGLGLALPEHAKKAEHLVEHVPRAERTQVAHDVIRFAELKLLKPALSLGIAHLGAIEMREVRATGNDFDPAQGCGIKLPTFHLLATGMSEAHRGVRFVDESL